jgi:tetratricopeptide (TPR) repeat protein
MKEMILARRHIWRPVLRGVCLSALVWSGSVVSRADEADDVRAALGWQVPPAGDYEPYRTGSIFRVTSAPEQWPQALVATEKWLGAGPTFEDKPEEHLKRRLARLQAMALNAAQPEVLMQLKQERMALLALVKKWSETKTPSENSWRMRSVGRELVQLTQKLGPWLADGPREKLEMFKAELAACKSDEAKPPAVTTKATMTPGTTPPVASMGDFMMGLFFGRKRTEADESASDETALNLRERIDVPELMEWTELAEVDALLSEIYALPLKVEFSVAERTQARAKALILAGKIKPVMIPWALFEWPDNRADMAAAKELAALYDVCAEVFATMKPGKPKNDWELGRRQARLACVLGGLGRTEEGLKWLAKTDKTSPDFPHHGTVEATFAAAVWDFLEKAAGVNADEKAWQTLRDLAPIARRSAQLVALTERLGATCEAGSVEADMWQLRRGWALVAADNTQVGLPLLQAIFERGTKNEIEAWATEWASSATRLLKLVKVLGLSELGLKLRASLKEKFENPTSPLWLKDDLFSEYADQELALRNYASVERLLQNRLKPSVLKAEFMSQRYETEKALEKQGEWLVDVLARQGRHADVITWLAEYPHWKRGDIADTMEEGESGRRALALVAAESLAQTGQGENAKLILETYLKRNLGSDPAYALYTAMVGVNALPRLERLAAADRYEERALIWTADVLLKAGRIDEAERAVKQAIAIDPSDGGTPRGDRMRAYAVAQEIASKKGDTKQAEFLGRVVAAIRLSEDADELAEAGLIDRAIAQYQRALGLFADAYCIQSRLAIRLASENRMDEAIEHYKRAYELMPDSFGRVESHCFGCESAFAGERPQAVAERVFLGLIAMPPVKPQVFYLMGYLRKEQSRWDEAAGYFSQAVVADPLYLNAWDKLSDALLHTNQSWAERDRVALKILELAPHRFTEAEGIKGMRDIPALWREGATILTVEDKAPAKLYALGLKAKKTSAEANVRRYIWDTGNARLSPEALVEGHEIIAAVVSVLDEIQAR